MSRERAARADGAIVWTRRVRDDGGATRVLPDGCIDVIWAEGRLIVAGPDTEAHLVHSPAGAELHAVRFAPGAAPDLLGVPAHELRNRQVPLEELWPAAEVRRLAERVHDASDRGRELADRLGAAPAEPWVDWLVGRLRSGSAVGVLADRIALSERQLHRRCLALFGYGPKTLARILRLGRALELARTGAPLGRVAADAGYADQAHLSREVKALAGVSPTDLLR
jgi:AraC-like DNA-binding protein